MAENQLIFGLKRQYAKTLGFIRLGEDRAADLDHLAAVIHMFNPAEDLTAIKPIRPYRPKRERWNREAIAILKASGAPMTSREIAEAILEARGIPYTYQDMKRIQCSLYADMARLEGRGVNTVADAPRRWLLSSIG